jgi:hypothetical protein
MDLDSWTNRHASNRAWLLSLVAQLGKVQEFGKLQDNLDRRTWSFFSVGSLLSILIILESKFLFLQTLRGLPSLYMTWWVILIKSIWNSVRLRKLRMWDSRTWRRRREQMVESFRQLRPPKAQIPPKRMTQVFIQSLTSLIASSSVLMFHQKPVASNDFPFATWKEDFPDSEARREHLFRKESNLEDQK